MALSSRMSLGAPRRAAAPRPLAPRPPAGLARAARLPAQRRRAPAPANALALPPMDWNGQKPLLQQLLAFVLAAAPKPARRASDTM